MTPGKKVRNPRKRTTIRGALALRGQEFPFILKRQVLELGKAGNVHYFYMLPSDLRGDDPTREVSNFRSCIGYWWAAMHEIAAETEWEQQRHFVMAICYGLVNRNKSLQDVYLDALPRPDSINNDLLSLPEEAQNRIRQVIDARNRLAVKQELDAVLSVFQPSREDKIGFEKAFQTWVDKGVNALRHDGDDGVVRWLGEIDYWMHKYRKRCPPRVRNFVNFFGYQAKVSFYTCYANFWSSLIPWLQENHALDELSARFLSLWHNQNQPIEIPRGRTPRGLWYPTRRGMRLRVPPRGNSAWDKGIVVEFPRIGPEVVEDVFCGQILSLHPLTWYLAADPALREVVGRFLASGEYETVSRRQDTRDCPKYWEFVGAVLTAAHLYRIAHDDFENRRSVRQQGGDAVEVVPKDEAPPPARSFLDAYFASHQIRCHCGGAYEWIDLDPAPEEQKARQVPVRCAGCGHRTSITVTEDEIQTYLLGEGDSSD